MQKIDKSLSKKYLPLVLYLDHLEEIISTLNVGGNRVEIRTDDYIFDSLSELTEHFKSNSPKTIEIRSSGIYCRIELNTLWAELYVSSTSTEASGIFYKIDQILSSSQRRPYWAYSYYFVWAINIANLVQNILPKSISYSLIPIVLNLLFVWIVWVLYVRIRKHSTIVLKHRVHKQSFIKRHSDAIILLFLGSILAFVINELGKLILEKFHN